MKKTIAITGGIGSGKSTVLKFLAEQGYACFSCDNILHEIMLFPEYVKSIQKEFPTCVVDGQIDKKALAAVVFHDDKKREILDKIAHPMIMRELFRKIEECPQNLIFIEVPLLFEGKYEHDFDVVLVIKRRLLERISAVMERDEMEEQNVCSRISAQFDYDSPTGQKRMVDCNAIILDNSGTKREVEYKILQIVDKIKHS